MLGDIRLTFLGGTLVDDAAAEAVSMATKYNVAVTFRFNGVLLRAEPRSTASAVVEQYFQTYQGYKEEKEVL